MILQRPVRSAWTGIWLLDISNACHILTDIEFDHRSILAPSAASSWSCLTGARGNSRHLASRRGADTCRIELCRNVQEAAYGEHDGAGVQLEQRSDYAKSDTYGSTRVFMLVETHMDDE